MADVITKQELIDASEDAHTLEEVVNSDDQTEVTSRLGRVYPSIAKALYSIIQTGGFEPFATEAQLLASVPTVSKKAAKALDTKKIWLWNGSSWVDTGLSELDQANTYTNEKLTTEEARLLEFVVKMIDGGQFQYAEKNAYTENGYINSSGAFISSSAGYKTTKLIAIGQTQKLKSIANTSISVAQVAFYDSNKAFISAFLGNSTTSEKTITIPTTARFIRACNNGSVFSDPSVYVVLDGVINNPNLIKKSSLTLEYSENLADQSLIINDAYVNSSGTITNATGWKYIKIPVAAGKTYTFGRFSIDTGGYAAFYDSNSAYISGSVNNFNNGLLPRTVTAPSGAAYLLIDVARPSNTSANYAELTVNEGATLIDYVDATPTITKIAGYGIAGTGGGSEPTPLPDNIVLQGANATLADVIADSITIGALIANLPTSSAGLEIGQAYIDSGFIKVVM